MANAETAKFKESLLSRGLRGSVAREMARAASSHRKRKTSPKVVRKVVENLKAMAAEIEERSSAGVRSAAAQKGALTRKRNASKRSATAKKAAKTRRKASS